MEGGSAGLVSGQVRRAKGMKWVSRMYGDVMAPDGHYSVVALTEPELRTEGDPLLVYAAVNLSFTHALDKAGRPDSLTNCSDGQVSAC